MKKILTAVAVVLAGSCSSQRSDVQLGFATRYLEIVESEFRQADAFETVRYLSGFWRVAGNAGFDSAAMYVTRELSEGGYAESTSSGKSAVAFTWRADTSQLDERLAWTPHDARIHVESSQGDRVFEDTYERTPVLLTGNSFSAHVETAIIDVGYGSREEDYSGKNVSGSVVLGDAPAPVLFLHAVKHHGAIGVVSAFVPDHNRPEENPDLVAEETIPLSESSAAFALKISRSSAQRIRQALKQGSCKARIDIDAELKPSQLKTVIAEIRGSEMPTERIVCVAHLDHYKPGANDNASGSAAMLEMALTVKRLIEGHQVDAPARTITFLWVDEYLSEFHPGGTGYWSSAYPIDFAETKAALVMDMMGGDAAKTGGVFRLEKYPDPSAIWTREPDEHSGWGADLIDETQLRGSFINDYVWHVGETYAQSRSWSIRRNPFEGGSDHKAFIDAKIPAVLFWHFPDQYYHSNGDDLDKVSALELKRSAVVVAACALGLASLNNEAAQAVAELLSREGKKRLENEWEHSRRAVSGGVGPERERRILAAWTTWYAEAIASVAKAAVKPDQRLLALLAEMGEDFKAFGDEFVRRL